MAAAVAVHWAPIRRALGFEIRVTLGLGEFEIEGLTMKTK